MKHGGVFCAKGGHQNPLKTKKEIIRYYGVAVGPACIISQFECPYLTIGRARPTFGNARNGMGIFGVEVDQAFEKRVGDARLQHAGDFLRIECGRLGGIVYY